MRKVVITGGSGYVGFRLGCHIAKHCPELGTVVLSDLRHPRDPLPDGVEFVAGDIRSQTDVSIALRGADAVIHLASYGMSDVEGLHTELVEEVNVGGTQNIIKECQRQGVSRLVYVSSYNAIWDNVTAYEGGTEADVTYVSQPACTDPYSLTKAEAEKAVLAANGTPLAPGGTLQTCALRPAGIWGPGEQRHMPRIIKLARQGYVCCVFGDPSSKVDFVHVDNLINACVLATKSLKDDTSVAAGKAYFINDEQPINNFDFFGSILTGLGFTWPTRRAPYWLVYLAALLMELTAHILYTVTNRVLFVPILSRKEVAKCAITHTFKCDLARKDLGYQPHKHTVEHTIKWYKARGFGPIPLSPELRALRLVRRIRVVLALGLVALILGAWLRAAANEASKKLNPGLAAPAAPELAPLTMATGIPSPEHAAEL